MSLKPILLENDGVFGQLPDGGIINAGGTSSGTFTVGGRGLLFDDGSSTATVSGAGLTLQSAYNASTTVNGKAGIQLSAGKDLVITDPNSDGNFFTISSVDGTVTINGNLLVNGISTVLETTTLKSDHWLVQPLSPNTTAISIIPDPSLTGMVADLFSVRTKAGAAPAVRIDNNGNLLLTQNLTVNGLINGVNLAALNTEVQTHNAGTAWNHYAADVFITPITGLNATNVQQALQQLETNITNIVNSGGGGHGGNTGSCFGYNFIQTAPALSWTIPHMGATLNAVVNIYDGANQQIIPQHVQLVDINNILVTFLSPQVGRAVVILF